MPAPATHRYLIALGSNARHARFGAPRRVLAAALERLAAEGVRVIAAAPVIETEPVGPSIRRYANSAAVIETALDPEALLALLKRLEREFGRRPGGRRWRARVLDLDLVLWSGGVFPLPFRGGARGGACKIARRGVSAPTPTPPLKGRGLSGHARGTLTIPHPLFRERDFVLTPAAAIAPAWRDPITSLTLRQLHARLTRLAALPKRTAGKGP